MQHKPLDWFGNEHHKPSSDTDKLALAYSGDSPDTLQNQTDASGLLRKWHSSGFSLTGDDILVPLGQQPIVPTLMAFHREEVILFHRPHYITIVQQNGNFAVAELNL